jgi:predicted O-methyltransferase YrrM
MGTISEAEAGRLDAVFRRNRERWAAGELPASELFYLEVFNAAAARSGLAVPPLYPVGNAANAGLLYVLFRLLTEFADRHVLEIGAGQSTLLLDALARAGRIASVLTVEADAEWAARIGAQVEHPVTVAPLRPATVAGIATEVFEVRPDRRYDIVLVDAPVGTPRHSRWGMLELLEAALGVEFVVIFDDAERPGERQTIAEFLARHPEASHAFVHAMKSQCLVFTPSYRAAASY